MNTSRDRLLSALAALLVVGLAAAIVVLVLDVQSRGRTALERERQQQVEALAQNLDTRLSASNASMQGFANQTEWTMTSGSAADQEVLEATQQLLGDQVSTGFLLIDRDGVIVNGTLLPPGTIGTVLQRPGLDDALASGQPGILPVTDGLTAAGPVLTLYGPVLGEDGQSVGLLALESLVEVDSTFNEEVSRYSAGETGFFAFVDDGGTVVASSDPGLLAAAFTDADLLTRPDGFHRYDGRIHVLADVPSLGWRAVSIQDVDEFEAGLGTQVGRALLILGLGAAVAAAAAFVALLRRLRAARVEQQRLTEINETREEFISIVSHELRTPVAGVLGFLQSTLDHWPSMTDDQRLHAIERAAANSRRLHALTRDVIDTTAIESGRISYLFEPVDLAEELRSGVVAARDAHPSRTIELTGGDEPVRAKVDGDRMQQVLANLLDNAVKNSPSGTPVHVGLSADAEHATITVRDEGRGLSQQDVEAIFDKFVRGKGSAVEGTGLGLFIARQIITAHGGTITADAGPSGGAQFTVTLPLEPSTADLQG